MSQSFGDDASRLSGMVCRLLGWRPPEFWEATPAEIASIFSGNGDGENQSVSRSQLNALMEQDDNG